MKRLLGWSLFALLASLFMLSTSTVAAVNVNNFRISNFDIEYRLARDSDNRSYLDVTERITADFPNYNQNKGLVREIPTRYDGRKVRIELQSVTRNGQAEPIYDQYNQNSHKVVELGTDDYVLGRQVYELRYRLHDVTKFYADTRRDEFYWDTNGTNWRVPIDRLVVSVKLEDGIVAAYTGNKVCYQGASGSNNECELREVGAGEFLAVATGLAPYQNVTIALGFQPETFAAYEPTLLDTLFSWWVKSLFITIPAGVMAIVVVFVQAYRRTYRLGETGTIVPEYLPPRDASVVVAAEVLGGYKSRSVMGASLIDLAVRRIININEIRPKSFWRAAEYEIEIVGDTTQLRAEEAEVLGDLLGGAPAPGGKITTTEMRSNTLIGLRMQDNATKLKRLMRGEYQLRARNEKQVKQIRDAAFALLLLGILTLGPALLAAALVAYATSFAVWTLTDKGLELRRYLMGLKTYIGVAETERLKMLQSPESAIKVPNTDINNPAQLVKLYEKVLPYAVLFGQEEQWTKVLGKYYENTDSQPTWYHGTTAFTAASLGQVASAVSTSAASSSSSGGSSGGGSSGGGGGGGGGGGR